MLQATRRTLYCQLPRHLPAAGRYSVYTLIPLILEVLLHQSNIIQSIEWHKEEGSSVGPSSASDVKTRLLRQYEKVPVYRAFLNKMYLSNGRAVYCESRVLSKHNRAWPNARLL